MGSDVPTFNLFIGGEWVAGVSGETFESRNPADWGDVVGRFQAANVADVAMAIRAAEEALPAWRAMPAPGRGKILARFGALLDAHRERLARALTRETGMVLSEAMDDVGRGIEIALLVAGEGRRLQGATLPAGLPDRWSMTVRQPVGVAGIITPWCDPIATACARLLPALVAGNALVFKPASDTPHGATLLVELLAEAGFPPGTINLVTGSGPDAGDPIVESRDVPVVSFTGQTATGRAIAVKTARLLKRVSLDLGAKNAAAVMADADLDLAADGILRSAFGAAGQRCTACSRVVVDRPVLGPLLERLDARTRALRLGSGLEPATTVGPLINEAALASVAEYVEIGRREGELVVGGRAATEGPLAPGWYFEPTIFTGVMPMARIAQEEIFGPVLSVIPVDGYAEVVRAVNGVRTGLSASIYTRNLETASRAMRDFETGIVHVNAGTTESETHLPFGGWKESGNGRGRAGHAALDTFTQWKTVAVDFSGELPRGQAAETPYPSG